MDDHLTINIGPMSCYLRPRRSPIGSLKLLVVLHSHLKGPRCARRTGHLWRKQEVSCVPKYIVKLLWGKHPSSYMQELTLGWVNSHQASIHVSWGLGAGRVSASRIKSTVTSEKFTKSHFFNNTVEPRHPKYQRYNFQGYRANNV